MTFPVLLHPGFHKTGTTFLQDVVFDDARNFIQPWSRPLIAEQMIDPHELAFDVKTVRARFLAEMPATSGKAIPVLSEEGLSGNPFNGARESAAMARKLRAVFDNAKVLITVRAQRGILRATYIQYLKAYGRRPPEQFFWPPRYPEFCAFDPDAYQFDRLVRFYVELFGARNVLVLPQELLRKDQAQFLHMLGAFVGRDLRDMRGGKEGRNVSPGAGGMRFLRIGNRFAPSAFNETAPPGASWLLSTVFRSLGYRQSGLFSADVSRMAQLLDRFDGYYRESNLLLQQYCPVDLAALGFDLPSNN